MKITASKRLQKEDFDKEEYGIIEKIAFVINPLIEQIVTGFNKNINVVDNLNMEAKDIEVEVDENGIPRIAVSFKSSLNTKLAGIVVMRSEYLATAASSMPVLAISNITASVPTTITTSTVHNYKTGDKVNISGSDSTPSIDGLYTITVIDSDKFQIPVNVTVAGATGSSQLYFNKYPSNAPFLTFIENNKNVSIQHVTGLPPNIKFKLTLLTIGS